MVAPRAIARPCRTVSQEVRMSVPVRSSFALPCLVAAIAIAGCGGDEKTPAIAASSAATSKPANSSKAPPTRPEDELPKARCPSKAGASLPGPDVVGLKLGMSFDEALNHARCAMPDGVIGFSPRWFDRMQMHGIALEKQGFTIQRGETSECVFRQLGDAAKCGLGRRVWDHVDETIRVASPGLDGRQTVVGLWRQQNWKPGQMPSRDAVLNALREKYGREGELRDEQYNTVSWRYDAAGQPLQSSDPQFQQCYGISARADGSQAWREGCGLSITADLIPPRDNPDLVQTLHVGMVHQENLLRYGDAMQAELDRLDAERRSAEVARGSGAAPTL
jgi:hypothetical protein